LLAKTKQELIAMKPHSLVAEEVQQNPAFMCISKAVENIEAAKKRKEEILN